MMGAHWIELTHFLMLVMMLRVVSADVHIKRWAIAAAIGLEGRCGVLGSAVFGQLALDTARRVDAIIMLLI